jgi:hypothetical protein
MHLSDYQLNTNSHYIKLLIISMFSNVRGVRSKTERFIANLHFPHSGLPG